MLVVANDFKLLAEIALFALAGQWISGLLAVRQKHQPVLPRGATIGKALDAGCALALAACRARPALPLVAVLLVALVWLVAAVAKVSICLKIGLGLCR